MTELSILLNEENKVHTVPSCVVYLGSREGSFLVACLFHLVMNLLLRVMRCSLTQKEYTIGISAGSQAQLILPARL